MSFQFKNKLLKYSPFLEYEFTDLMLVSFIEDDKFKGVVLTVESIKNKMRLRIVFDEIISYKSTNESFMTTIFFNDTGCSFNMVNDSTWLNDFHSKTHDVFREWDVKHYCFYIFDTYYEFLSEFEPKIEVL